MTYHLASMRLRSIGERSARFADLTLDLTAPAGPAGLSNVPTDSIVWLRNGGGKSSLLSLFYALLLPHANDFMGRAVKRSLTDYVDSGDTSHTIAVWHPAENPTLLGDPERVLITGAIYEWHDLRRPADPDKDRDRLGASYYAFFAVPGVIDATTLPLTGDDGRPLRRSAVLATLRDLAADHVTAMDLTLPRNQREWTEDLQARGIDPELYRRQKEMNHVEGGVEDLFRFASPREFIDFLIDLTVPPDEATPVADRLARIADVLATRPARTAERDFCREAAITLGRIASASDGLTSSTAGLATAEQTAGRLAARFAASLQEGRTALAGLDEQREVIVDLGSRARSIRAEAADLEFLYLHHAAGLRIDAARAAHESAGHTARQASATADAWRLTARLAEQSELAAQLQQLRIDAGEERRQTAPLRSARDDRAAGLINRLTTLADQADAESVKALEESRSQEQQAAAWDQAATAARAESSTATVDVATAQTHLGELDKQIQQAVRAGVLSGADSDPERERRLRAARRDEGQRALAGVRQARAERPRRRRDAAERLQELTSGRTSTDAARENALAGRRALQQRADDLAGMPRIRDLAEATPSAPVDVQAETPAVLGRLVDEIRRADEDLIRAEATRLDEERSLDAQSRTGLLPTSLDAARICASLVSHGIPAEPGWTHLRGTWPTDRLADLLTDPGLARLGCGVVVPDEKVAQALAVLGSLDEVTTALVGVYSALTADRLVREPAAQPLGGADRAGAGQPAPDPGDADRDDPANRPVQQAIGGHHPFWTGLNPGLVDAAFAEAAVQAIRRRHAHDDVSREALREQREHDRRLFERLDALRRDCPDGLLDSLTARIGEFDALLDQTDQRLAQVRSELAALDDDDHADAVDESRLVDEIGQLGESVLLLGSLAEKVVDAPDWRALLSGARRRQSEAADDAGRHALRDQEARAAAALARHRASDFTREAASHRSEAAGIEFLEPRPGPGSADPSVPLDTLRRLFQEAERDYRHQVSGSVLAEQERNTADRLSKIRAELSHAPGQVVDLADQLLRSAEGQSGQSRARASSAAEEARNDAAARVGRAEGGVAIAEQALQTLTARRALPVRALPAVAATAEVAGELAQEQTLRVERAAQDELDAEAQLRAIGTQAGEHEHRLTILGYLIDGLPEPLHDDDFRGGQQVRHVPEAAPAAFIGDEVAAKAARAEVLRALASAQDQHRQAETAFTAAINGVRTVAGRFPAVATPARDRVLNDPPDVLARSAEGLAANLTLRATMIDGELEGIAADQSIVAASLAHLVTDTLDTLRKAERYSRLPASLGTWAGQQMLRIQFDQPASDGDLGAHVDRVIERCVADGVKPQGLPLLKAAVHEAVGPRGFRVKILKPTQDVTPASEDITRLGKWSGGEKLTVCVALYCTLAALRARNTGRGNASGGVLVLDNPIGRASHGSLVRLQRDVAAAHGVQLIYTTGVKDPDAVSSFPNVIRLDNRPGRTRSRRYIVATAGTAPDGDIRTVVGTRVAHTEADEDD